MTGANLLPGRSFLHHLYPLLVAERPFPETKSLKLPVASPLPLPAARGVKEPWFPPATLLERLTFGIEREGRFMPVEVKWTNNPSLADARHLLRFLAEHPKQAKHGYIICRCNAPLRLHDKVTALPWFCL